MNYQERLSVTQVLDILDREVGKKQDNPIGIRNLYSILYELNQRQESTFVPEEQSNYITTADRLTLTYGATVDGVLVQEGIIVNQGGLVYTLINNDPSLVSSWVEITNSGLVTFPDLQIEGASSINYNNIFNKPIAAEGINVIEVKARSTANIPATYDNGTLGVGATLTTTGTLTTLDGYTLLVNDEVAIINQSNPIHNGIYTVTSIGATTLLTRSLNGDETTDLYPSEITIANGTLHANRKYRQVTVNPVIGTNNIVYEAITIDDVSSPSYVSGRTIYVDRLSNFATDTRTGVSKYNRDRPFSTIQAAVNASTSAALDVIMVISGTYAETVTGVKANTTVIFNKCTHTGNITNQTSEGGVTIHYIDSTITGNPNPNNNTNTGQVILENSNLTFVGTLSGTFATRFIGVGNSSITCTKLADIDSSGGEDIRNLTINGTCHLLNGNYRNCIINGTVTVRESTSTGSMYNCTINNPSGNAFTPVNGVRLNNLIDCTVIANRLFNDAGRILNITNCKGTQFTLTNNTTVLSGTIKMIGCSSNLTKINMAGGATITDYFTQFSY